MPVRDLTILVPAYNEVQRIGGTIERIAAWCPGELDSWEILVVDDGSEDGTAELVETRFAQQARLVRRSARGGKGAAIRSGVAAARKPWVLFVDADLSIPIEELAKLVPLAERTPIVIGSKRAPGNDLEYPPLRHFLGGIGQRIIGTFVVSGFHDTQCGFKLYRTEVARELFAHQRLDGFGFDFELLFLARRLGHPVSEVGVRCAHQLGGSVRLKSYLAVLGEVARLSWARVRGRYPARR